MEGNGLSIGFYFHDPLRKSKGFENIDEQKN